MILFSKACHTSVELPAYDRAFNALRNGTIKPGTKVKVWDPEVNNYITGILDWHSKMPCILIK